MKILIGMALGAWALTASVPQLLTLPLRWRVFMALAEVAFGHPFTHFGP